jgi:hypothetical protein
MANDDMKYGKGKAAQDKAAEIGMREEEFVDLFGPEFRAQTGDARVDLINEMNLPGLDAQLRDAVRVWLTLRERLRNTMREIGSHERTLAKIEALLVAKTPSEQYKAGSAKERERKLNALVQSDDQWLLANVLLQEALQAKREMNMEIEDADQIISVTARRLQWRTSYIVGGILVKMGKIEPDQIEEALALA